MKKLSIFLLVIAFSGAAISQVDLESGLVGYFPLDETGEFFVSNMATGTDIMPDGEILSEPEWVDGISGSALQFSNASTGHVEFGDYDPSIDTDELSVSVWMNWAGLDGGWHSVCGKRDGWDAPLIMWDICLDQNSGGIQFETNTANGKQFIITPDPPTVGEWVHVAVVFDGYWAQIYMDGLLVVEGDMVFGEGRDASFHLGCGTTGGVDCFSGILDEFRVYNRLLTENEIDVLSDPSSVNRVAQDKISLVSDYVLHQNYPNPFNPNTTIGFSLLKPSNVSLKIFNISGQEIATLANGFYPSGLHEIQWMANGQPSGIYLYELQAGEYSAKRKLILQK